MFSGGAPGDLFARTMAGGDFDGDNLADLAVGAPGASCYAFGGSCVYVFVGSPGAPPDPAADWSTHAPMMDPGLAIASRGHVRGGGGEARLAVGSPSYTTWDVTATPLDVFSMLTGVCSNPSSLGSDVGATLALAGDVDGDCSDDLLVGAPDRDVTGNVDAGAALLIGSSSGPCEWGSSPVWEGTGPGDRLSAALSGPGDLDGDGFDDIAFAAPWNDGAGVDAGRVHVVFGAPAPGAAIPLLLDGPAAGALWGAALAGGDLDADLYADLLVGAPGDDTAGTDTGAVYVFLGGSAGLDVVADAVLTGATTGQAFGTALAQ